MRHFDRKEILDQRIKERLQSSYVHWLARNKPDTFCYRASWRKFLRSGRRIFRSFWKRFDSLVPEWVVLGLGCVAGLCLATGVIYVGSIFAWHFFHSPPPKVAQLSIEDQARVGFFRLAAIQFAALLTLIPMGITFRDSSEENRDFKRAMPSDRRRVQVFSIRVFAGAMVALSWIGAELISLDLPSYVLGVIATGTTGTILFWSAHWMSRWLGGVRFYWEGKNSEAFGATIGVILCLVAFLVALLPESVAYARHLAWLGPTGWMYDLARQAGEAKLQHAWQLIGTWGLLLGVGVIARKKTITWEHRRRVLRRIDANPPAEAQAYSQRRELPPEEMPANFRNRLSGIPLTLREWFFPAWIRSARTLLGTIAVCCFAMQGVAWFLHSVISQLAEPDQPLMHSEQLLVYTAIAVMVGTLELCQLYYQDRAYASSFEQMPISPWSLWERLQFSGLIRLPIAILWSLPMLVIPVIINPYDPSLALFTLGLSLSAAIALRTLVAATIVPVAIHRELHELVAAGFTLFAMGLGLCVLILIMLAAVPGFPGSYWFVWRQLAAHGGSMLLFLLATMVWSWVPRLASTYSQE